MDDKNTNYSKLTPELKAKLLEWEKKKPENQQLQVLTDVAMMLQELINVADDTKKQSKDSLKAIGAVLTDAREQLVQLNKKEAPEQPDHSKSIVDAVDKMRTSVAHEISKIDFKPKISSPEVKIPAIKLPEIKIPETKVDLTEFNEILKTDIPKAFKEAIDSIPQTEIPEAPDRWDEVLEWLQSIDTASRMKPQAPTTLKVLNPDGTNVGAVINYSVIIDDYTTANTLYIGKAVIGTATSSATWQISKLNTSSGLVKTWADSNSSFDNVFDNRASLTYG